MKKALMLILLLPFVAYSQTKPNIEPKHYIGEDNKLYWHGKKPVYIFISDNPEGKNAQRLESQIHPQFTNPLYLDTEGINYFRTNWAADSTLKQISPKTEVLFEVYRDNTAPVTTVNFKGANKFKSRDGKVFYGKSLEMNSTAFDKHSGVQKTFVSINNADFLEFKGAQTFTEDKEYDIKIYSADNTGNVEAIKIFQFRVDSTAPMTEYIVNGDRSGMIFSPRTTITLKSRDMASGIKKIGFRIDNGTEKVFYNNISLSRLEDGNHTITYYGYDQVGNKEQEKTIDFYLDRQEPKVDASIVGDQYQNRGRVFVSTRTKVKLIAEDNKAGVKNIMYSVDGAKEERYYEPFTLDKSKGNHIVTYYATDKVNNKLEGRIEESNFNRSSLDIDMDAPEISFSFKGEKYENRDTVFITSKSKVTLTAFDEESGVRTIGYKVNGGEGKTYSDPFSISEEGFYTVDFYATDRVNNRNTKSFSFVIDNTGPEIGATVSMEKIGTIALDEKDGKVINVYPKGIKLFLSGTDAVVDTDKLYYSINQGSEILYTKPIVLGTKGLISYKIKAIDKLGNETTQDPKEVFIK